jgi:hypothetical protein
MGLGPCARPMAAKRLFLCSYNIIMSGICKIEMSGSVALDLPPLAIGGGEFVATQGDPGNERSCQIPGDIGKFGGSHPGECRGIGTGDERVSSVSASVTGQAGRYKGYGPPSSG